jgi:hypothetical protein
MAKCRRCGTEVDGNFCSNCGERLPAGKEYEAVTALKGFFGIVPSLLKIGGAWRFIWTAYRPFRELRETLTYRKMQFSDALAIYLEVGLFAQYISLKFKQWYETAGLAPLNAPLVENDFVFALLIILMQVLTLAVFFLLPRSLFYPHSRLNAVSIIYLASCYGAIYGAIIGGLQILLYYTCASPITSLFSLFGFIAIFIFGLLVYRRVLELSWGRVVIILIVTNIIGGIAGFIIGWNSV